eukprot:355172-Chlamydomonas_euryale.AAC.3
MNGRHPPPAQHAASAVVGGFDALTGPNCSVELHRPIGLAVLRSPNPMHYYALFSQTCGCDYVLTMYSGGRCGRH